MADHVGESRDANVGVVRVKCNEPRLNHLNMLDEEKDKLDSILRPHLRLEPSIETRITRRDNKKPAKGLPVDRTTVETDNKKRPGIMRLNSIKYNPPPPQDSDPNSEVKSAVISRMNDNLIDWDKRLQDITVKKKETDELHKKEIEKRDAEKKDLTNKLDHETKTRQELEKLKNELTNKLITTENNLAHQMETSQQLHANLMSYEVMYQEMEGKCVELEEANGELTEKLTMMEEMKRRLNDQVTDLQGQVSILERRSAICIIL
jgi:small-conductance mechanosensitive channel